MDPYTGQLHDPTDLDAMGLLAPGVRDRLVNVSGPEESIVELAARVKEALTGASPMDARREARENLQRLADERRRRERRA